MRTWWPWLALVAALFGGAALVRARGDDGPVEGGMSVVLAQPGGPAATATPAPDPAGPAVIELTGFAMPIAAACLPDIDSVMPNAPREYRNGVHEGVDLYPELACAGIQRGTEVRAMADGIVVRIDHEYQPITRAEAAVQDSSPASLDRFRGRQVWVEHGVLESGEAVVTRYAHLDNVAADLEVGDQVREGRVVGYVGNSGTPEGLDDPDAEIHLHFEVRIGEGFLGQGEPPDIVRESYIELLS